MYTDVKPYFVLTHINWKRAEQARDDEKSEYYSLHSIFNWLTSLYRMGQCMV